MSIPPGEYVEVGNFTCDGSHEYDAATKSCIRTIQMTATEAFSSLMAFVIYMVLYIFGATILTKIYITASESMEEEAMLIVKIVIGGALVMAAIPLLLMLPTIANAITLTV